MSEQPTKPQDTEIHLVAGLKNDGELIYETVEAKNVGDGCYTLSRSPLFAKGTAKGDTIRMLSAGSFDVEKRGGNICVRVIARDNIDIIKMRLNAELQKLDAECDYENERSLVYNIAVEKGFDAIEKAFNQALKDQENNALWLYANVYDPVDGQTPLNWWHDYLAK